MKNILQLLLFIMVVGISTLNAQDTLIYEDFEAGVMPAEWSEYIGSAAHGWEFGTDGGNNGAFSSTPPHTTYATIDDIKYHPIEYDSVLLMTPSFDLSSLELPQMEFYTFYDARYAGRFEVKISTDGGVTYPTIIKSFDSENLTDWQFVEIDLSAYTLETNVSIAFYYDDDDGGDGVIHPYSIDDVFIYGSPQHDFAVRSISPTFDTEGGVIPTVTIKNQGVSDETTWSVQLTSTDGYSETISDEATILGGNTYDVYFPQWNPAEGSHTLTATITLTDDSNSSNDVLSEDVTIVKPFAENATAGNGARAKYYDIGLKDGSITNLGAFPSLSPRITSEEFAGDYNLYRINTDQELFTVNPTTGSATLVTTLADPPAGDFSSLAYDWQNDIMYIMYTTTSPSLLATLATLDLETYAVSDIGTVANDFIVGMDMAADGFLYATTPDDNLIKIDPSDASSTVIGNIGHDFNGTHRDLSYDRENDLLLTIDQTNTGSYYGYYDLASGAFFQIKEMSETWNYTSLAHFYIPQSVKFIVSDANGLLENADVNINGQIISTNSSGEATLNLINGTYNYTVSKNGYDNFTSSVTVNDNNVDVPVTLVETEYLVTFNVSDDSGPLVGATVDINSQLETTNSSGIATIELPNGDYPYTVSLTGYDDVTGSVNVSDGPATEDATLVESTYSVTFTVTDGTNPLSGANITVNSTEKTTNASGVAIFYLVNGDYSYTVSLNNYDDATGTVSVNNTDVNENVTLSETTYNVTFSVTDGTNPLDGATVNINESDLTTAGGGLASIELPTGDYPYLISLDGYDDFSGSVSVVSDDVSETVIMTESTYTVTFTVTDGTDPLEGALVEITTESLSTTTNASGTATFMLPADMYDYEISLNLYDTRTGSVTVPIGGTTVNEALTLTPYNATFTVTDGSNPLEGANVNINETNYLTDASGVATTTDLPPDTYTYTVSLSGYDTESGDITIETSDVSVPVILNETTYSATFIVSDGTDPLEGATIIINGETILSDIDGTASIELVPGDYPYTVDLAGYDQASGNISVVDQALTEDVTLSLTTYLVTFNVTDGNDPIEAAAININGEIINTGTDGTATTNLIPGDYPYTVDLDGYEQASGNIAVVNQPVNEDVTLTEITYLVTFNVTDSENALEGATINIDGGTISSGSDGTASIDLVPGDYPYTVDLDGYEQASGNIAVVNQPVNEDVTLTEITYLVTFNVTNGENALEGATINIDGGTISSGSDGIASIELVSGDYPYTVDLDGYEQASGNIAVVNQPVNEDVTLTETTYLVTFNVTDGTNPLEGATININGGAITTTADGNASIDLVPDSYDYSVSHPEFSNSVEGSVTVVDAAITEEVEMGVGIENNQLSSIKIYPNPTVGEININCRGKAEVIILSASGKVVKTATVNNMGTIDLGAFSEGTYFMQLTIGDKSETRQIILRK